MIRIAVVGDDWYISSRIERILLSYDHISTYDLDIEVFQNGLDYFKYLKNECNFDLIFRYNRRKYMIFELLQKIIDSALIQSFQNYLLKIRNALTLSTARAVFVFYGVFFITYFLSFRWFLFSILYGIKGKKKRAKKNAFWKQHRTLAWFFLKNGVIEKMEGTYPKASKLCVVYNIVSLSFILFGTLFLLLSIVSSLAYQLFLDTAYLYIILVFFPSTIFEFIFKVLNRNK